MASTSSDDGGTDDETEQANANANAALAPHPKSKKQQPLQDRPVRCDCGGEREGLSAAAMLSF
jgi:hypothetical protein